jgi:lipoic acid synthetase
MKVGDVLQLRETPNMVDKTDAHIIPVINVGSGEKFVTASGVHAIKDGIKSAKETAPRAKKPDFLRMRVRHSPKYESVKDIVKQHRLAYGLRGSKMPQHQ